MHIPPSTLKTIIIRAGLATDEQYEKSELESGRLNTSIENVLIGQFGMNERYFFEALGEYLKLSLDHPKPEEIPTDQYPLISENIAKTKNVFLLKRENHTVHVAMTDPNDLATVNYLEAKLEAHVEPHLIAPADFSELLKLYKRNISREFQRIIEENTQKVAASATKGATLASELPVITMLDTILEHAAASRASDIHIEPTSENVVVRYRVDGILHDIVQLPSIIESALVARIKIMSSLQIDEHRVPQDGRFKFKYEEEEIAVRVSVMPTLHGEKAALRLLASSRRPLNLADLGATKRNFELLRNCIKRANGLVLVTGPTGCGKTTTLYTLIGMLNKPEVSIATIEDPIEYDMVRVNQTQVNEKTGLTFAEGLRAFLRQNPDIMMVGEIRDKETTELAIHASLTGHLVLSTLHTDDAATAVPRLLDLGAEPFLLASTVRTVIAQRLVRKICPNCATSKPVSEEVQKAILEQLARSNKYRVSYTPPAELYSGVGCSKCGELGYRGLIGIFEIFDITPQIADLILKRTSAEVVKEIALQQGMITMFEDGLEKTESGITTIDEIFRVIRM